MINSKVVIFDVSFWQDNDYTPYKIDFIQMKSQGGDGVIIRAGQNMWLDEDYLDNAKSADLAMLPRGAYWYYDSRAHPKVQADLFADIVEISGFPKLGIWGDYEEKYNGIYKGQGNFKTFLDRLKERFPNKLIGIYTGPSYWIENTTPTYRTVFRDYPLWLAHYRVPTPTIPLPWTEYTIWQITDQGDGKLFGAESEEIDMNVFNGTLEEYRLKFDIPYYVPGETPPPPQGEEGMFEVVSSLYRMSLRATNEVTGTKLGDIATNKVMIADRIEPQVSGGILGDRWAHIPAVQCTDGVTREGWVAVIHNGSIYCTYREIPSTTPTHKIEVYVDGVLEYSKEF